MNFSYWGTRTVKCLPICMKMTINQLSTFCQSTYEPFVAALQNMVVVILSCCMNNLPVCPSAFSFSFPEPRPGPSGQQRERTAEGSQTTETETGSQSQRGQLCLLTVCPHTVLCLPVTTCLSSQCQRNIFSSQASWNNRSNDIRASCYLFTISSFFLSKLRLIQ